MKLIHNISGFSLRKIITSYEILDPKSETGSKEIASGELANEDIVVAATINTNCLKKLFDAFGENAIMLQTGEDEKIESVQFAPEMLPPSDIVALLAQEPPTRYAAHPRAD